MFDAIDFKWNEKTDKITKLNREIKRLGMVKKNFCEEKEEIIRINGKIEGIEYAIKILNEESKTVQIKKIYKKGKEKLALKNKELEMLIIEKDKEILYLQGMIDGLKKQINAEIVINKLNKKKMTMNQARELLGLPRIESKNGRRRNGRR